jgi:hypothetical protein
MMAAVGLVIAAGPAAAGPVTIHDDSNVLDAAQVTTAGNALPDPVQVFTTVKDANDATAFDRETQSHVTRSTDVVLAINTQSHHLAIRTGSNSHIRDTSAAGTAFRSAFGSGNYTGATVAALNSLAGAASQPGPAHANQPVPQAHRSHSHGFNPLGILCPVIIVGLIIAAVVAVIRRRRRGGSFGGGGGMPPGGYGPGPGYGPQYGPGPGYGPGYDPGYGQRGGIGAGMAGGLGAAAGGLLGYELGKEVGERDERDREHDRGSYDQGGGYYDQPTQDYGGGGGDYGFGGGDNGGGFDGGFGGDSGGGGDF